MRQRETQKREEGQSGRSNEREREKEFKKKRKYLVRHLEWQAG